MSILFQIGLVIGILIPIILFFYDKSIIIYPFKKIFNDTVFFKDKIYLDEYFALFIFYTSLIFIWLVITLFWFLTIPLILISYGAYKFINYIKNYNE